MKRIEQIASLIKKELASVIYDTLEEKLGILSITRVEVQSDLKGAKVYISCIHDEDIKDVLRELNAHIPAFQTFLSRRIRIRHLPKISFHPDLFYKNVERLDSILVDINKGKA